MQKQQLLNKSVLPMMLLALGALAGQAQKPQLDSGISGVTEARVGQLVVLDAAKADRYDWEVIGRDCDYRVNGTQLIFSAEQSGEYLIVCALTKGGLVDIVLHRLIVGQKVPEPGPEPVPEPGPEPSLSDFEIKVRNWLPEGYNRETANRLAYSFDVAASTNNQNVDALINLTVLSNRAALGKDLAAWMPFLKQFSSYCQENMQEASLEDHKQLWLNVSAALRK